MDRQIYQLNTRSLDLTDVFPSQDVAGGSEAGQSTFQALQDLLMPKVYAGILSQTSTNAPTATVVANTLSGSIIYTRNSAGNYTGTLVGAFTVGKTIILPMNQQIPIADRTVFISASNADTISILVRKISDGSFVDLGQVDSIAIKIEVYA